MIPFLLVGGQKHPSKKNKRIPLSINEVINIIQDFPEDNDHPCQRFKNRIRTKRRDLDFQDIVKKWSEHQFGNSVTHQMIYNRCIAGAVILKSSNDPDDNANDIIDAKAKVSYFVSDVIQASSGASLKNQDLVKINKQKYFEIYCPIREAIPRALEILGPNSRLESVLSIASPNKSGRSGSRLDPNETFFKNKKKYKEALFIRIAPNANDLQDDDHDNQDILEKIIDTAVLIAAKNLKLSKTNNVNDVIEVLLKIGRDMISRSKVESSTSLCKNLIKHFTNDKCQNHGLKLQFYKLYGDCFFIESYLEKALEYYNKALKIQDEQGLPSNPELLKNLAICKMKLKDYEGAKVLFETVLDLNVQAAKVQSVAIALSNLGRIHHKLGHESKSMEYFKESLQVYKKIAKDSDTILDKFSQGLTEMSQDLAKILYDLANYLLEKNDLTMALQYHLSASELQHPRSLSIAKSWHQIGHIYFLQSQHQLAKQYLQESLEIKQLILGHENVQVARTLGLLGMTYHMLEDQSRAVGYIEEAMRIGKMLRLKLDFQKSERSKVK